MRNQLPRIWDRLAALSDSSLIDAQVPSLDIKAFSRAQDLAVATAARDIGWSGRSIFLYGEPRVVELYWWFREFEFERFLIELRQSFVATLNSALRLAGRECSFDASIRFQGFPTLKEVDNATHHLIAGDRTLTDINAPFTRS